MTDRIMDCSRIPSDTGCTLRIIGRESEVLDAAVAHAVAVHGHTDTPELHDQMRATLADVPAAGFVQLIEFRSDDVSELDALEDQWESETEGARRTIRAVMCGDRDEPGRYVVLVEFPSHEDAMANNDLPATAHFAEQFAKAVSDGPSFRNLDVVRTRM